MADDLENLGNSGKAHIQRALDQLNAETLPAASTLDGTELVAVVQGAATKRTTAQDIADLGGGGGGGNWWDVTSAPGDALESTTHAADPDNSGWPGGTQKMLSMENIHVDGDGDWSYLRIGDKTGPLGKEIIFDPFWNLTLALMGGVSIGTYAKATYDPDDIDGFGFSQMDPGGFWGSAADVTEGNGNDSNNLRLVAKYFPSGGSLQEPDLQLSVHIVDVDTSKWEMRLLSNNTAVLRFDQNNHPILPTVPTSDPAINHAFFTKDFADLTAGDRVVVASQG